MKEKRNLDRRVERTRGLLLNSLIELLFEKKYTTITIKDITDRANVGRSTFYAHFENKEQLFFSGHEIFVNNLLQVQKQPNNTVTFYKELFEHAAKHQKLAKVIIRKNEDNLMFNRMKELLINYFRNFAQKEVIASSKIDLFAPAFAATIIELISGWLIYDQPFSIEVMSQKSDQISKNFIQLAR